jgi:hypothetical protein
VTKQNCDALSNIHTVRLAREVASCPAGGASLKWVAADELCVGRRINNRIEEAEESERPSFFQTMMLSYRRQMPS